MVIAGLIMIFAFYRCLGDLVAALEVASTAGTVTNGDITKEFSSSFLDA